MDITINELGQLTPDSYILLDMRGDVEVGHGIIPGAIHMSKEEILEKYSGGLVKADEAEAAEREDSAEKKLIIYCARGRISQELAEELRDRGYDAYSLKGGYTSWLLNEMKNQQADEVCAQVEKSIRKKFRKNIWCKFTKAINQYELVKEGDCIAVMDCDLQHPPETLIKMYRLWEDGYQVIEGVKASRGRESFIHKMFAKTFYSIISDATGIDMSRASDFKLMDRQAAEEFLKLPERNVFFRALSSWVGFKTIYVEFDVQEREAGESKWSFKSLVRYAVNNITSFSAAPMQIVTFFGVVFFVFAVLLGIQSLYMYFSGHAVAGFTTVILLLLLVGSILMFSLGVIGYYIAKIYDEVKMRPRYIISEVIKSKE